MKKAYVVLTIASCMLAMTAAVAQHVPVVDPLTDCPVACDPYAGPPPDATVCFVAQDYGDPCVTTPGMTCPVDWPTTPFAPMPTWPLEMDFTNIVLVSQDPIVVSLPATYDFCAWSDQVYCTLFTLAAAIPISGIEVVLDFAELVKCENIDLNGELNTCMDVPVTSNGIPDRYELGLLAAVLNSASQTHKAAAVAAMQNNMNELVNLINDALVAEVGATIVTAIQLNCPWLIPGLAGLLSGFATLGDANTDAALNEVLGLLEQIGLTPPPGGIASICDSVSAIGPDGKVAGGAFTNREIYEWYIQVNPAMTVSEYTALCLNPATTVPATVSISGGGTKLTGSDVTLAANLSNVASGYSAASYVWYKWGDTGNDVCANPPDCDQFCDVYDWIVIPGETGSALTINAAQLTDSGQYAVSGHAGRYDSVWVRAGVGGLQRRRWPRE